MRMMTIMMKTTMMTVMMKTKMTTIMIIMTILITMMMMTTMMTMRKIMTTTMATNTPSNGSFKPQLRLILVFHRPFIFSLTKIAF